MAANRFDVFERELGVDAVVHPGASTYVDYTHDEGHGATGEPDVMAPAPRTRQRCEPRGANPGLCKS